MTPTPARAVHKSLTRTPGLRTLGTGLLGAGLLAGWLIAPAPARADVTPDQAQALEVQIRTWLATVLGANVPLSATPVHVAPEGDHYRLSVPVATGSGGVIITGDPVSALVKPIDGTRWAVDDMRIPSPVRVENTGSGSDTFKSMAIKIADQSFKGVIDLSMATTSTLEGTLRGYTSTTETGQGTQVTHIDLYTSHATWQPVAGSMLNLLADGHGTGLSNESTAPDGTPIHLAAASLDLTAHADGVAIDQFGAVIHSITDLIPIINAEQKAKAARDAAAKPGAAKPGADTPGAAAQNGVPPAARPALRALLAAAQGMMHGLEEEYSVKDVAFDVGGHSGTLARMAMGLGFAAPEGRMDMHMMMAVDGLDSPEIPPGFIHDYIPKHVSIRPRVSGVPTADLVAFLQHAIDSDGTDGDALSAEALGLLAKGPLSIGIDDVSLDAGPATLKGTGSLQITDPQTIAGNAQLRVSGYDKLIAQSGANPALKQAAPVLIFLKGIGKQDGDSVIWNITYQDKALLVNGTDLSSMIPSDSK